MNIANKCFRFLNFLKLEMMVYNEVFFLNWILDLRDNLMIYINNLDKVKSLSFMLSFFFPF